MTSLPPTDHSKTIAIVTEEPAGIGGVVFTLHNIAEMLARGYKVDLITGTPEKFSSGIAKLPALQEALDNGLIHLTTLPQGPMEDDAADVTAQQRFLEDNPSFQVEHSRATTRALDGIAERGDNLQALLYVKSLNRMRYWLYDQTLEDSFRYAKEHGITLATENRANSDDFSLGFDTEKLLQLHQEVDCFFVCSDARIDQITTHSEVARQLPPSKIEYIGYKEGVPGGDKPPAASKTKDIGLFFSPGGTWIEQYETTYPMLIDAKRNLANYQSDNTLAESWVLAIPEGAPAEVVERIQALNHDGTVELKIGHIPKHEFDTMAGRAAIMVTSGGHTAVQMAGMKDGPRTIVIPLQQGDTPGEQMLSAVNLHTKGFATAAFKDLDGKAAGFVEEALIQVAPANDLGDIGKPFVVKDGNSFLQSLNHALDRNTLGKTIDFGGAKNLMDRLELKIRQKTQGNFSGFASTPPGNASLSASP